MSLVSLTCKNRSYVQTHTCTAEGSLPDRGQPLSWRKREPREGGRKGRREGGRREEKRETALSFTERVEE